MINRAITHTFHKSNNHQIKNVREKRKITSSLKSFEGSTDEDMEKIREEIRKNTRRETEQKKKKIRKGISLASSLDFDIEIEKEKEEIEKEKRKENPSFAEIEYLETRIEFHKKRKEIQRKMLELEKEMPQFNKEIKATKEEKFEQDIHHEKDLKEENFFQKVKRKIVK